MKLRIKDRRMKERVVGLKYKLEKEEVNLDFSTLFEKCEVFRVIIEPTNGGIFGDI